MMFKGKKRFLLIFLFLILYLFCYVLMELYKNSRVNEMLDEEQRYLELSYNQGLDRFNVIAENIYISMQNDKKLVDIIASIDDKNIDKKHQQLYAYLKDEFVRLQLSGIMGLDIIRPNNQSVLRMHKIKKYGDDLSVRPIIVQANRDRVHLSGFEKGKSIHAFRQIFPLYKNGKYIGALEILFSSTKLQEYTMHSSNIHTHFLVDKHLFQTNDWQSRVAEHYVPSIEHKDFLFSLNEHINNKLLMQREKSIVESLQEEINEGVSKGESFHLYTIKDEKAEILVFYAVKRFVDNKRAAYLVSYTKSRKLYDFLNVIKMVELGLFFLLILIYFILVGFLKEQERLLSELKHDALTNIYNRRYFTTLMKDKYETTGNHTEPFSLVMADIDLFKNVNDTYGHQYGDVVLQEFARILKCSLRSADIVARYGGEEFVILLAANEENALKVMEKIRKKIEEHLFGEKSIHVTASFGLIESHNSSLFLEDLKKADDALYKAKENGRNRVVVG